MLDDNNPNGAYTKVAPSLQLSKEQYLANALLHYKKGLYEESIRDCEQAINIDPHYDRAYHGIALSFYELQEYKKALPACQQAIQINPNNIKLYICKGNILYKLEDFNGALAAYKRALLLNPSNTKALEGEKNTIAMLDTQVKDETKWNLPWNYRPPTSDSLAFYNNEWKLPSSVHPANCRCHKCWEP